MADFAYNPDPFASLSIPTKIKEFKVKTGKFTFLARVGPDFVGIGGKDKTCVEISPSTKKLMWLTSNREGKCEVNGLSIGGDATVLMAQLAMTIVRKEYPDIDELVLEDSSTIHCVLPDASKRPISLNVRDALIYGQTFYERKFGATEINAPIMSAFRKNRMDPSKKPSAFNFNSNELKPILQPIYNTTRTWAEFLHTIYVKFGGINVCTYMYPWYKSAFYKIIGYADAPFDWQINVWNQPDVPYVIVEENVQSGGYWDTVQQPLQRPSFNGGGILLMPYSTYKYRSKRKTRKLKTR